MGEPRATCIAQRMCDGECMDEGSWTGSSGSTMGGPLSPGCELARSVAARPWCVPSREVLLHKRRLFPSHSIVLMSACTRVNSRRLAISCSPGKARSSTACHRCGRTINEPHGSDKPCLLRHLPVLGGCICAFDPNAFAVRSVMTTSPPRIRSTPKHGSWRNMAECEFAVLQRQCLSTRIASAELVQAKTAAWEAQRNTAKAIVQWWFTNKNARAKLKRLYTSSS